MIGQKLLEFFLLSRGSSFFKGSKDLSNSSAGFFGCLRGHPGGLADVKLARTCFSVPKLSQESSGSLIARVILSGMFIGSIDGMDAPPNFVEHLRPRGS